MSCVVTGGGRGVGRGIVERLLADGGTVVVIERDPGALSWVERHTGPGRLVAVVGDAADEGVAGRAADLAERAAPLTGWVNNAAVFRDASVHDAPVGEVVDLITRNLRPAVVGSATAVRRFLAAGTGGAVVNISSHQASRPVPGCLPYATAKAAVEGLTRALAVEYGPHGIRTNALALGSVTTERHEALLAGLEPDQARRIQAELARLHPVGRIGLSQDVAEAVAYLLSPTAGFVNGVTLPVDGGRSALGLDPESR
ncbi:NAD(P)-dependent dehydrogenase, short-chain alcohol dehydrogenase family [Micromonospora phaseoli]|uniref:NAD(P)-dependent dehydrogenase, short-chain alcohol dehydrogenase family n=1 Tax=Micromonospora phaseoli TaxID=1144548 RepID=A0A1H7CI63_9ACTN|nr:SDR family oxidoreductase [Micromonospora phaseoli]PZV97769.1 NAD(P)-dependent dehydrogenase (short-subunit alcohol dehydrogenase family) [Micromonospora phaseoli]GIJ78495.1 short-chain dehydrogenase [Micromonospora phaseoli]SEJ89318.1 NAD(P)-dependent dehydrogenase, short-chain alcohol dehydrogenase family [Micromonospora phaseoli]